MPPDKRRKTAARAYDAMIAATAVANDLPVYTCNPGGFQGIDELKLVSIPVPPFGDDSLASTGNPG